MRTALLLALAANLLALPAGASVVTYTTTGVFGAGVPTSVFTPGAPDSRIWTLQFSIDQTPTVTPFLDAFTAPPLDFHYFVASVELPLAPSAIYFYDTANFGMFTVEFNAQDCLSFSGPVMFSGTVFSPIMLPGVFIDDNSVSGSSDGVFVGDVNRQSLNGTVVIATIPEPWAAPVVALALLTFVTFRRRSTDRARGRSGYSGV